MHEGKPHKSILSSSIGAIKGEISNWGKMFSEIGSEVSSYFKSPPSKQSASQVKEKITKTGVNPSMHKSNIIANMPEGPEKRTAISNALSRK